MEFDKLVEQNLWWKDKDLIEKDYDIGKWKEKKYSWIPEIVNEIDLKPFALHIILGPRQSGKTTALKLFIRELLKKIEPRSLFYFNCDEIADYKELSDVIETYLTFKDDNHIESSIILLDEITSPKEWYRAIKSFIDKGKLKKDVVILTGSSSIAIKREVELFPGRRGNGKDFILFPLSFREFLKVINPALHNKIEPIENIDELEAVSKAMPYIEELNQELKKYFNYGGFPLGIEAMIKGKNEAKTAYLSWIKTSILKTGRNDTIARQILKALLEKMPSAISWESISKEIEIKSPKTVAAYVDLFKSMFALIILYSIDISKKKIKFGKNKKVHVLDPLLLEILEDWCLTSIKNKESILAESVFAIHLSRLFPERIFFWKNKFEVDAVILIKNKVYGFEVKWSEKPEAKKLPQFKKFVLVTKKDFSKNPLTIPLSVFLSVLKI